jgi:mono/diheme cytochrome c family protein
MRGHFTLCVMLLTLAAPGGLIAAESTPGVPEQAYAILKKYCHRCHGADLVTPGLNVLERETLLASRGPDDNPFVTPGDLDHSYLWQRVGENQDMPPADSPQQPTAEERETLRAWIASGAEFPVRQTRSFVDEKQVLLAIRNYLRTIDKADRKFQRFFTLNDLFNNHRNITEDELRQCRAALSKLVNSLSWKRDIVVPLAIDEEQTVMAVDLRKLGWDRKDLWKEILKLYPYGLKLDSHRDDTVRRLAQEVDKLADGELTYVRAGWFIATASRPPLYHTMLDLPEELSKLRTKLNVDPESDFVDNALARSAFIDSKVSNQNRLVDRHHSIYGAYWESYDFKTNDGEGNLLQFPLGPAFEKNTFTKQVFKHDGGEVIFTLPNGLQGYLLVDEKGKRIDAGPIEIVSDSLNTSGTPAIVNGLSCMACHSKGVIPVRDVVRDATALTGEARDKVQQLFVKQDVMDELLKKDEARFMAALAQAISPFLQVGDDRNRDLREFAEPVGNVARWYIKELSVDEVAGELDINDPQAVRYMIQGNLRLRQVGMGALGQGGTIKREVWSTLVGGTSPFLELARELELGEAFKLEEEKKKK